ncbi:MAG: hypothetical protein AVDCRST_MAG75-3150 [uncultured Propionibacteriaceae bacterium]|uniref:Uncharacterized protein n=1 Tax=uncultured Propionibacteriaceae bacterium TaxID=257457 RepID=A0A6J4PJT3_9ACTN|nr:MAG: hypothetical protein AVDCRST_MAG75-3150 [uncultured Propionibacteriaceae bacterium]
MSAWFDSEQVITPLEAFATLPDWLAAGMNGTRVKESLERHLTKGKEGAEGVEGPPRLLSCTPERLRAKGEEWLGDL